MKAALCQTRVFDEKSDSLNNAERVIKEASEKGSDVIVLPEMFTCPYSGKNFRKYSEREDDSETLQRMASLASSEKVYIVAGSIPELTDDGIYNTSYVFDREGKIIAKHRKAHLFDINVKGKISFMESKHLLRGESFTVFDTEWGKAGLCICFDVRFPEFICSMAKQGANIIFVPAAFNMVTGPAHWHQLFRTRSIDNQLFLVGVSPARDKDGSYKAFGHSLAVNPWGEVIAEAQDGEETVYADIDINEVARIREEFPIFSSRRPELYKVD